jgi:hypothetical protein
MKHTRVSPKVPGLTYKIGAKWKMLRGIYSAIYGEVNVSVSGGYVLKYVGGTRASSCFICHLKKLIRPETFGPYHVFQPLKAHYMVSKI